MFIAIDPLPELSASPSPRDAARLRTGAPLLTPREYEALELAARGFSYAEVARLLLISVHTTHSHMKNIYAKLDVHSKSEAVFEATALGLLRPGFRPVAYHARRENLHDGDANHSESGSGTAGFFAGA